MGMTARVFIPCLHNIQLSSQPTSCPIGTADKGTGAWSWPFTSI